MRLLKIMLAYEAPFVTSCSLVESDGLLHRGLTLQIIVDIRNLLDACLCIVECPHLLIVKMMISTFRHLLIYF